MIDVGQSKRRNCPNFIITTIYENFKDSETLLHTIILKDQKFDYYVLELVSSDVNVITTAHNWNNSENF